MKNSLLLSIFLTIIVSFFIYSSSSVGIMNSVDGPQYALTRAMVDDKSFRINNYLDYVHPDFIFHKENYYSSREPIESLIAIPFYKLAKITSKYLSPPYNNSHPGINFDSKIESATTTINSLSATFSVTVIFLFGYLFTKNIIVSLLSSFAFGLGSLNWAFGGSFVRQPIITFLLLCVLYTQYKIYTFGLKTQLLAFLSLSLGLLFSLERLMLPVILYSILFFIFMYVKKKQFKSCNNIYSLILIFLLFFSISNLFNFIYYGLIFSNPFTSSFKHLNNFEVFSSNVQAFSSPWISIFINLFSYKPIPIGATSPLLQLLPPDNNFSINWLHTKNYLGIFIQSPYLFASFLGLILFFKKNRHFTLYSFFCFATMHILYSKHIGYFSPNNYNTRYFLPMVGILSIFTAYGLCRTCKVINNAMLKKTLYHIFSVLIIFSFRNAILSVFNNFAPHITGENRYIYSTSSTISQTLLNLFPNYKNALFFSFIFLPFFYFVSIRLQKSLIKKK